MIERDPPEFEALSVAELKEHLRVDFDVDDQLISQYAKAARAWIEDWTALTIGTTRVTQRIDVCRSSHPLPTYPIQSIDSIEQINEAGQWSTITDAAPELILDTRGAMIYFPRPPAKRTSRPLEFRLTFLAGWSEPGLVPDPILDAIRLIVAESYEQRLPTSGQPAIPPIIDRLLTPYRMLGEL